MFFITTSITMFRKYKNGNGRNFVFYLKGSEINFFFLIIQVFQLCLRSSNKVSEDFYKGILTGMRMLTELRILL